MSDKIKELVERLRMMRNMMDEQHIPLEKREAIKNRIVGALVAAQLPIPSSPIEGNPRLYFTNFQLADANVFIGAINEHIVCNVDEVVKCVYDVWKGRYDLVHHPLQGVIASLNAVYPEHRDDIDFAAMVIGVQ